jgi:transcriptional regulator with XRE-family HTH domain
MRTDSATLRKIGTRIRKERTARQIKQETLGKAVNLSKSEISRIENGKRETILTCFNNSEFEIQ